MTDQEREFEWDGELLLRDSGPSQMVANLHIDTNTLEVLSDALEDEDYTLKGATRNDKLRELADELRQEADDRDRDTLSHIDVLARRDCARRIEEIIDE